MRTHRALLRTHGTVRRRAVHNFCHDISYSYGSTDVQTRNSLERHVLRCCRVICHHGLQRRRTTALRTSACARRLMALPVPNGCRHDISTLLTNQYDQRSTPSNQLASPGIKPRAISLSVLHCWLCTTPLFLFFWGLSTMPFLRRPGAMPP